MSALRHDVSVRRIAGAGALIAGTVVLVVAVVVVELRHWGVPLGGVREPAAGANVEGPALESAPQPALRRYREEKARLLGSTGWVDERAGIARIPIDDAMALLAQQGLRAAPAEAPEAAR